VDNLKSKYLNEIESSKKEKYISNLKTINNQIKQIENLVNEFSDFARMPKPVFKSNNLNEIITTNINLIKKIDTTISFKLKKNEHTDLNIFCDYEQISRVFFNLLKNSIESIQEKVKKTSNINKIINIEIAMRRDYIAINITDDGIGFSSKSAKDLIKPYFTTKEKGTGLGLSIVNKIISDHNGTINFETIKNGAKIEINLPIKKNVN